MCVCARARTRVPVYVRVCVYGQNYSTNVVPYHNYTQPLDPATVVTITKSND